MKVASASNPHDQASEWGIRIGDTGPGLPPKAREHLFAAFQGGARKGGTGLGLAIVRHVASNHGGEVRVESTEGVGSAFTLVLPGAVRSQNTGVESFAPSQSRTSTSSQEDT